MKIKETKLNKYPDSYFDFPGKFCSKDVDSEQWKKKIGLKFYCIKRQNSMLKLYRLREKILSSKTLKESLTEEEKKYWTETYEMINKNYKRFVEVMNILQKNDPHFDYKLDALCVYD